jgi:hypothetical protein
MFKSLLGGDRLLSSPLTMRNCVYRRRADHPEEGEGAEIRRSGIKAIDRSDQIIIDENRGQKGSEQRGTNPPHQAVIMMAAKNVLKGGRGADIGLD